MEALVVSKKRWNPTGMLLEAGRRYRITVPVGQTWVDWKIRSGPEGKTSWLQFIFRPWLRLKKENGRRAEFFTLIGTIGMSDERAFIIGKGPRDIRPTVSGELFCFANDVDSDSAYANNRGEMRIEVVEV